MTTDLRFSKLRTLLKADPYGLLCRLYDFAASMQQDGDISQIDGAVLAHRLEFNGTGARLRKILTKSGYLNEQGCIVTWQSKLFRLFTSAREQNRDRGLKSAAMRAQARTQPEPSQTGEERIQQKRRGEDITATVERSVQRPVETTALAPHPNAWPDSLPPDLLARLAEETRRTQNQVREFYPEFLDTMRRFNTQFNQTGLSELRDKLRKKKFPPRAVAHGTSPADLPEPTWGWRAACQNLPDDDFRKTYADREWGPIDGSSKSEILKLQQALPQCI